MNVTSSALSSISCPYNTTLGFGRSLTCNGTYTIQPWDLERGILYISANASSRSLPQSNVSVGPPVVLQLLAQPQLAVDVVASSCTQVSLPGGYVSFHSRSSASPANLPGVLLLPMCLHVAPIIQGLALALCALHFVLCAQAAAQTKLCSARSSSVIVGVSRSTTSPLLR